MKPRKTYERISFCRTRQRNRPLRLDTPSTASQTSDATQAKATTFLKVSTNSGISTNWRAMKMGNRIADERMNNRPGSVRTSERASEVTLLPEFVTGIREIAKRMIAE